MEEGAEVRGKGIIHGFVELVFREKNVYVSKCACVYTTVCVDEGGLK